MSSVLTNEGAMTALRTLRAMNRNLSQAQNTVATGLGVASVKDNAALWGISKVLESEVGAFRAIGSNLGLGKATVDVARAAAETTTDLLNQLKQKVIAAREDNIDREKVQADIDGLRGQIASVTRSAHFNGLNLLYNTDVGDADDGRINVLAGLDRTSPRATASEIVVQKQDLAQTRAVISNGAGIGNSSFSVADTQLTATDTMNVFAHDPALDAGGGGSVAGSIFSFTVTNNALSTPESKTVTIGFREGDDLADMQTGIEQAITYAARAVGMKIDVSYDTGSGQYVATNATDDGSDLNIAISGQQNVIDDVQAFRNAPTDRQVGGALALLADFDVTTTNGADAAVFAVEDMIQTAIEASTAFGSALKRIEAQEDFIIGLKDALRAGIGTLVDADMEEESVRLQALQVQKDLGYQTLSIANQSPQALLSLFNG